VEETEESGTKGKGKENDCMTNLTDFEKSFTKET